MGPFTLGPTNLSLNYKTRDKRFKLVPQKLVTVLGHIAHKEDLAIALVHRRAATVLIQVMTPPAREGKRLLCMHARL
eukprot:7811968-Pyramimonas_sp.AAC.1